MKLSLIDLYFLGFLESNILKTYGNERSKFSHNDKNGNKNLFKFWVGFKRRQAVTVAELLLIASRVLDVNFSFCAYNVIVFFPNPVTWLGTLSFENEKNGFESLKNCLNFVPKN